MLQLKSSKTYFGCDNGVTGSIGVLTGSEVYLYHTPVFEQLNYTKTKQFLKRVNGIELIEIFKRHMTANTFVLLERPMVNPTRFKATISAVRCLEAMMIIIETLKLPYAFEDSKSWQKSLLPSGLEKGELKMASTQVGQRLYPHIDFSSFDDADGILIATYAKKMGF